MCGWVQDRVPDHRKEKTTVKVHVWGGFSDLNGFHSPTLPERFGSTLDCCTVRVDAVVCLLNMNCNAVVGVSLPHCLSVLT